jgi:UDP:flavonoid glycosyltransferase YjiC (YdhE family)
MTLTGRRVSVHCLDNADCREFWRADGRPVDWLGDADLGLLAPVSDDVVSVDWLDSDTDQVAALSERCAAVALLDDYGPAAETARLVVNALLSPLAPGERSTNAGRIVSGARWLQLPPEATKLRSVTIPTLRALETELASPLPSEPGPVRMVLLNFGGQPRPELTALALDALRISGYTGKVSVAPSAAVGDSRGLEVDWHPSGPEFHSLLAASDLAICAGGLTLYEAAFLGVPAICIPLVEHQADTARKIEAAGACLDAGRPEGLSAESLSRIVAGLIASWNLRGGMAAAGMRLTDGRGLQRTAEAIVGMKVRNLHR